MRFQLFGLFFCILVLHGQTPLGTVSGLAVDASEGAVAAASVTLTNNDTGVRRTAATNTSGAYAFPDLPPGTYRAEYTLPALRNAMRDNIIVSLNQTTKINVPMQLEVSEVVTVTANQVVVDPTRLSEDLKRYEAVPMLF